MSRTKYVKFGARADKNLSDIPNPKKALDNILDNISVQVDEDGNTLRFTSDDLVPLIGISRGPLGQNVNSSGQANEFTQLADTTVEGTLIGAENTTVPVEPRITIQDHINNFKVALGDPPWINGGTGPSATMIAVERLNSNTVNYPEAVIDGDDAEPENSYRILEGESNMTFDQLQSVVGALTGDDGTKRLLTPVASTTLEQHNSVATIPYIIVDTGNGSFDFTTIGASAQTPPVGEIFTATLATSWLASQGHVIPSKTMGSFVQGKLYTITAIGTGLSTNLSEWSLLGVEGHPYPGKQFICQQAPADQTTNLTAYAMEHYSIGEFFDCLAPGQSISNADRLNLRNQTLPTGATHSTANPEDLPVSRFYTSKVDPANLFELIENVDFWERGKIQLAGPLHPDFSDLVGGVVWEGYQSGKFNPSFFTNGFFSLEEDVADDGNFRYVKGINSFLFETIGKVYLETVDNVTRLEFIDDRDWRRICEQHTVLIDGDGYQVFQVYYSADTATSKLRFYANLESDAGITDTDGRRLEIAYDRSEYELNTGNIDLTAPAGGKRRKIRYSAWWYEPSDEQEQQLDFKLFEHDHRDSGDALSYSFFYETDGTQDAYGRYTFPYFMENHAKKTNQEMTSKLTVDNTISMLLYEAKQDFGDALHYTTTSGSEKIQLKTAVLTDVGGTLETDTTNTGAEAFAVTRPGDVITFIKAYDTGNAGWGNASNQVWSFQLLDQNGYNKGFVSQDIGAGSGANMALNSKVIFASCSNEGLVGTYKASRSDAKTLTIRRTNNSAESFSRRIEDVAVGDLVYYTDLDQFYTTDSDILQVAHDGKPAVVTEVDYTTDANADGIYELITLTLSEHGSITSTASAPLNFSSTQNQANGLAFIYSSRGLNDLAGIHECSGVYGVEVAANANSGTNSVQLTDTNFSRIQVGDIVYFEAAVPQPTQDENQTGNTTVVRSKSTSPNTIVLENSGDQSDATFSQTVNAGATMVIVPSGSYSGSATQLKKNREYCVIPLNTAPPFSSNLDGLVTTDDYPNLDLEEMSFKTLSFNSLAAHQWSIATYDTGYLTTNSPIVPDIFHVGDFVKIDGAISTQGTGRLPDVHTDGRIYKVSQLAGGGQNPRLQYWNGSGWLNLHEASGGVNGTLVGHTFTRLPAVQSLSDVEYHEGTSESANRGSETSTEANQPDAFMDISYTAPGSNTERTFKILANTRDVVPK